MIGSRPNVENVTVQEWDVLVIGGGITGAGILLESARHNHKTLLIEQKDFAWGTSSRSSKMVHGGIRYLAQGQVKLTKESLQERERFIKELPNLVIRQPYHFLVHKNQWPNRWALKAVMWMYDKLANIKDHHWNSKKKLQKKFAGLGLQGLKGAMTYNDALTDDSRLVMRVLHEAHSHGATACNYLSADTIDQVNGKFCVTVKDELTGNMYQVSAKKVIHATGAWADKLSGSAPKVRPLRGSHLFIDKDRLPVGECLTIFHPKDSRPVFVYPWQGTTCIGTTDIDHTENLNIEAHCTPQECDYMLELVNYAFPQTNINRDDIIASIAGVRPTLSAGDDEDPSKVRRDHLIWEQDGLINVSGGKLTTFRVIALDALLKAGLITHKTHLEEVHHQAAYFTKPYKIPDELKGLGHPINAIAQGEALKAQIQWILDNEMVVHLDDLLLRRIRIGILCRNGGEHLLSEIKLITQQALDWDDIRWQKEVTRYLDIVRKFYAVPQEGQSKQHVA